MGKAGFMNGLVKAEPILRIPYIKSSSYKLFYTTLCSSFFFKYVAPHFGFTCMVGTLWIQ